jgi:hypothetical protein
VAEVEKVVSAQRMPLRIDLGYLTDADADGLQALRRLRDAGARVTKASPFIAMMLERAGAKNPQEPEPPTGKPAK